MKQAILFPFASITISIPPISMHNSGILVPILYSVGGYAYQYTVLVNTHSTPLINLRTSTTESNTNNIMPTLSSTSHSAHNGLRSAVESLKSLVNEEFMCPICLEPCTDTRTNPECLHRFCGDCINESLMRCNNECPTAEFIYLQSEPYAKIRSLIIS